MTDVSASYKPVVALDIDGTLAPWHDHFRQFIELYCGKPCPPNGGPTYRDGSLINGWDGSVPFYKWLGVSKQTYRDAKLAFRQGGFKRWMPTYAGASDTIGALRKQGVEIWICTTRPYLRLDNIDPDTRHWLRRNRIQFDGVLFGEHKYRQLKKIVGAQRIAAVIDDLPEMVRQAHDLGLPTVLRAQPYNTPSNWPRQARNMNEVAMHVMNLVHLWREQSETRSRLGK